MEYKLQITNYKILVGINIVLLLSLIVCIFFLTRKTPKEDPVKEVVIELLDEMIKETEDDFSKHFKYYESCSSSIRKNLDNFYVLRNQQNAFCSPKLMNYYNKNISNSHKTEVIFNTLSAIKNTQSQDFKLLSKFMEYRFIKKVIEYDGYLRFFWFDQVEAHKIYKKDTIQLGEENIIEYGTMGCSTNKEQTPILVIDGDTLNAEYGIYIFKEKPQKRGLVTHEGFITCFHPVEGIVEFKFGFRYYVK